MAYHLCVIKSKMLLLIKLGVVLNLASAQWHGGAPQLFPAKLSKEL